MLAAATEKSCLPRFYLVLGTESCSEVDNLRVPTVMEKHGKWAEQIKSWKLKNILEKSWNFFTADHESCTRSSDNSISTGLLQ